MKSPSGLIQPDADLELDPSHGAHPGEEDKAGADPVGDGVGEAHGRDGEERGELIDDVV